MSKKKNLVQLIRSLEKHEFDKVVKVYLSEEYGFDRTVNTDGKDDVGLDIRVFDFEGSRLQFQLTTQKSETAAEKKTFNAKLLQDFEKAKVNNIDFDFSNILLYFYSYPLTVKSVRQYEKIALAEYGIALTMIDANRLAEDAESLIRVQRELYTISGLQDFHLQESMLDSVNENLIFDLLSFGKASEFRIQIIEGFILKSLFEKNELSYKEIRDLCEKKFEVRENEVFYNKLLASLQTERRITKGDVDEKKVRLTKDERSLIQQKVDQYALDEDLFLDQIYKVLLRFGQEDNITDFIVQLKQLYTDNFNSDLQNVLVAGDSDSIFGLVKEFLAFCIAKVNDRDGAKKLALALLEICLDSKFIQKIAASKVYCSNLNNTRLEKYLNTKKKLFIDTPIALHALCFFYRKANGYKDYFYRISSSLIEFARNEGIKLYISERYIIEVEIQVREAFALLPFTRLSNFQKLGKSRNVFYNYYSFLLYEDYIDETLSFQGFLSEFGFSQESSRESLRSKVAHLLSQMNIVEYRHDFQYEIDKVIKIFDSWLLSNNKRKSQQAIRNDSIMVEFLAHNDVNVHPLQPVFLTWDRSFFEVQKVYFRDYPSCQKWLMLPPGKFIDSYAVLKFRIDNESVTEGLLAMISDEIIQNTQVLIDTIKFVLDPENEVSLEYTNRLAQIREEELDSINRKVKTPPEDFEGEAIIDEVFLSLSSHFQSKDKSDLIYFKEIFRRKDLMEDVLAILIKAVSATYEKSSTDFDYCQQFEQLVDLLKTEDV